MLFRSASKKHLMITKGAVEEIIALCHTFEHRSENLAFDAFNQECAFQTVKRLNEEGFRVIAIASKEVDVLQRNFTPEDECDLTLNGFIAFLDPAKEGVKEALDALHDCGVAVKVLTGDNDKVARSICKQVGLKVNNLFYDIPNTFLLSIVCLCIQFCLGNQVQNNTYCLL